MLLEKKLMIIESNQKETQDLFKLSVPELFSSIKIPKRIVLVFSIFLLIPDLVKTSKILLKMKMDLPKPPKKQSLNIL